MRTYILAVLVLLLASAANASQYGNYDTRRLLTVSESPAGKKYGFDIPYLDRMLGDLALHAKNYPPQFDTPNDRQRAVQDVKTLAGMLETLVNVPSPNPDLLIRAAELHSFGHNLDIAGSTEKANARFQQLLAARPSDARGNYMYGLFLAGAGKPAVALPYLDKARAAGITDALYAIGMTYLSLGDKKQAIKNLEDYKRRQSGNPDIDKLIEAIRSGKLEVRKSPQ